MKRQTIDANGNITEQPYGVGRWHSSRVRACVHPDCSNEAKVLRPADMCMDKAHNCCALHVVSDKHFPGCPHRYGRPGECIDPELLCAEAYR